MIDYEYEFSIEPLRKKIAKAGISLRKIGEQTGISHAAIHRWVNGDDYPNIRNLIIVCRFFNISPRSMFITRDDGRIHETAE
jgi:transcriptional regulator with XRE-family HTH domain